MSKRGLVPDSDEQTFEISIPLRLRLEYDRIVQPVLVTQVCVLVTQVCVLVTQVCVFQTLLRMIYERRLDSLCQAAA